MHCKYRELFVLSMAGKKGPARSAPSSRSSLCPAGVFFLNECGKRVCTQSPATNTRPGALLRVFRDSNNESGVYIGFRANSRSAGYSGSSDSAICLGIAEFTLYSLLRRQDPACKHTGLSSRKFTTPRYLHCDLTRTKY